MFKTHILVVIVIISTIATEGVADWSQFQGDAGHTAYVCGYFDASNFHKTWSLPLTQSLDIASQDGYLYVTQVGGSSQGTATVSRVDRFTGAVEWSTSLPYHSSRGVSPPAIQGETLYVHRWGHSGSSGSTQPKDKPSLVGIDADTGTQLFSTQHSGQWSSGSRPTIEGDTVFAAGGYYGGMDAYNLEGTNKWFARVNQQYGWIPAADADNAYVYMGEASSSPGPSVGQLYIVDRLTGNRSSIAHHRSTGTLSRSSDNGSVMLDGLGNAYALSRVYGGNTLVSFDIDVGAINWEADGSWDNNPAIANGIIAIPEDQSVVFLDATTGTRQWSWEHSSDVNGSIILTDNVAFAGTETGVYAIDLDSRTAIWNTPIEGHLAAVDGMLYITNDTGIFAFSAIPEPSCFVLVMGMMLFGMGSIRRSA